MTGACRKQQARWQALFSPVIRDAGKRSADLGVPSMPPSDDAVETILIVDDEEPVRKTFREWLEGAADQRERMRPLKRERRLHAQLAAFREVVEKILPLVQSAAVFNDPVPLPDAIRSFIRFLMRSTGAADGVLLVRSYNPEQIPP